MTGVGTDGGLVADRLAGRPVLITGGAGFVGTNLADRFAGWGLPVIVHDNLSRPGVERNLAWLQARHGDRIQAEVADIRDSERLAASVARCGAIFHFAAQVAVTASLADPGHDFAVNLGGTLALLDAIRTLGRPVPLVFSSTNKVYGALPGLRLREEAERYVPVDAAQARGVSETQPLDFHSPYGCSKGAADQYVLDHARSYGLPTAVFRMSCIYGPHQRGTEDQGWIAHFLLAAMAGRAITLYGTGRQVRDVLHVDDLVDAFVRALGRFEAVRGQAFNVGGGESNAVSLRWVIDLIAGLEGRRPLLAFGPWRTGDQPWYVSDTERLGKAIGWSPGVRAADGIAALHRWLLADRPTAWPAEAPQLRAAGR